MDENTIIFPNGNRARRVAPPAGTAASDIIKELDIPPPRALLLLFGGAAGLAETLTDRLLQVFNRAIARAAADAGAWIIDGGTQAGVMALMGRGVAGLRSKPPLIGVTPSGKVTYPGGPTAETVSEGAPLDPNHSHFVLVETNDWGGETDTLYEIADALAPGIGVATVLVGGGPISKDEILQAVRRRWPVIVIKGTGQLADEIAGLKENKPNFIDDPAAEEIIADADIHLFPLEGSLEELKRLLLRTLNPDKILELAWNQFALYDENAKCQQGSFNRLQLWILGLGVFVTLLVLTQSQLKLLNFFTNNDWYNTALRYVIITLPIAISILVAVGNRFRGGNKWVLLRAGAEAIKRQIFFYRSRVATSSDPESASMSPQARLAQELETISRRLMQTDVNLAGLRPYVGPIPPTMYGAAKDDDGVSPLTPEKYLKIRVGDQLNYYRLKTTRLGKQLQLLYWLVYLFGGLGTFLAAVGLELWVALTTALAGALTTYLGYQQVENSLLKYNQAATNLANIQAWWSALSPSEQADQKNFDKLVTQSEEILQGELTGWVQQMENALAKLKEAQVTKDEEESSGSRFTQK